MAVAGLAMNYLIALRPVDTPLPILSDSPEFVEPLHADQRLQAAPLVEDSDGGLTVRAWRWWYNARAIVEMENRLDAGATAVVVVHPWGIDDGDGLRTPEPSGVSFLCTPDKNRIAQAHMRTVVSPFLERLRGRVGLVAYSLPGTEDGIRKQLYASIDTPVSALNVDDGQQQWRALVEPWPFDGDPLPASFELDPEHPVRSYFAQTPATHTVWRYNRDFRAKVPMPVSASIRRDPRDLVFYDDDGYAKVKKFLQARGIRHILLAGYNTDLCIIRTTCGYENLSRDFNVFLVGDATLATFPASTTPRFATQVALANAALTQLVTQVSWIRFDAARASDSARHANETRP